MDKSVLLASLFAIIAVSAAMSVNSTGCETASWRWPYDFKLLSSNDHDKYFANYTCDILRDSNYFQSGKYFCWKTRKLPSPIMISETKEKDMECVGLYEIGDLTYYTKYLCVPTQLANKLKFNWSYIKFHGYDYKRCVGFNVLNLVADMWANNFLCGAKNVKIEEKNCYTSS